jgi:hypothetical protein
MVRTEWRDRKVEKFVEGPETVTTRTVTREVSPDVPGPERVTTVVQVVERGPVTIERASEATGAAKAETRTVTVTLPPAAWAVSAGLQVLPDRRLELGLERRVVGPVWARAWALQAAAMEPPALGVALRVEW